MNLMTNTTPVALWHEVVQDAEHRCSIILRQELEAYLVTLLIRYTDKPELVKKILATAFLEAIDKQDQPRPYSLQFVGDQCLIFAGLFPHIAERRHVKINYFVELGRHAYGAISNRTNDLYANLALQFVTLMDVLQSIRPDEGLLLPLEAYERWHDLGSRRALAILQSYTQAKSIIPRG